MDDIIKVKIADMGIAKNSSKLRTVVGSCVAVVIYDFKRKISGMVHIMLPEAKNNAKNVAKFADTAIPELIRQLTKKGASKTNGVIVYCGNTYIEGELYKNEYYVPSWRDEEENCFSGSYNFIY